ncbi:hypothetical protein ABPG73_006034 [Tetrahymena malaccensis]
MQSESQNYLSGNLLWVQDELSIEPTKNNQDSKKQVDEVLIREDIFMQSKLDITIQKKTQVFANRFTKQQNLNRKYQSIFNIQSRQFALIANSDPSYQSEKKKNNQYLSFTSQNDQQSDKQSKENEDLENNIKKQCQKIILTSNESLKQKIHQIQECIINQQNLQEDIQKQEERNNQKQNFYEKQNTFQQIVVESNISHEFNQKIVQDYQQDRQLLIDKDKTSDEQQNDVNGFCMSYASPEQQINDDLADTKAQIYSLGITFLKILQVFEEQSGSEEQTQKFKRLIEDKMIQQKLEQRIYCLKLHYQFLMINMSLVRIIENLTAFMLFNTIHRRYDCLRLHEKFIEQVLSEKKKEKQLAEFLCSLALCYYEQSDYANSLKHITESHKILEKNFKNENYIDIASSLNNLGSFFFFLKSLKILNHIFTDQEELQKSSSKNKQNYSEKEITQEQKLNSNFEKINYSDKDNSKASQFSTQNKQKSQDQITQNQKLSITKTHDQKKLTDLNLQADNSSNKLSINKLQIIPQAIKDQQILSAKDSQTKNKTPSNNSKQINISHEKQNNQNKKSQINQDSFQDKQILINQSLQIQNVSIMQNNQDQQQILADEHQKLMQKSPEQQNDQDLIFQNNADQSTSQNQHRQQNIEDKIIFTDKIQQQQITNELDQQNDQQNLQTQNLTKRQKYQDQQHILTDDHYQLTEKQPEQKNNQDLISSSAIDQSTQQKKLKQQNNKDQKILIDKHQKLIQILPKQQTIPDQIASNIIKQN